MRINGVWQLAKSRKAKVGRQKTTFSRSSQPRKSWDKMGIKLVARFSGTVVSINREFI